jgi:protein-tyrosine-phosphatase
MLLSWVRMAKRQAPSEMPTFVGLAGHPLRWRILTVLARSDRRVRELTELTGEPQSLVSYHLGRLWAGDVVGVRRSSADGRDSYSSVDLAHCGDLVVESGAALHPGLQLAPVDDRKEVTRCASRRVPQVLFLCTGNSARSQMAEALLVERARFPVRAFSAGSRPKPLHPNAVRVMRARGIDISGCRSKHLDEFKRHRFDHVVISAGRPMPDGRQPGSGGWNRTHFVVEDVVAETDQLRRAGVVFRNDIVTGPGGSQVVFDDPSGNPVELFQPAKSPPTR